MYAVFFNSTTGTYFSNYEIVYPPPEYSVQYYKSYTFAMLKKLNIARSPS